MDFLKKLIIVVFFLLSIAILARVFFIGNYLDFNSFYFAAKAYFSGGNPYGQLSGSLVGFLYAPTSFLFFSPFVLFPLKVAGLLWTFYSVALLVISVVLLFKIAKRKVFSYEFLGILGAVCMMFPVKFTLGMGQVGILNLFLVVLFFYFVSQQKEKLSGVFLSFSLLLKFFPLLFPIYLLILKKWKMLATLCIVLVTIFSVVLLFRQEQMIYFLTKSLPATFGTWPLAYYNQAISGMIGRWLGTGEVGQLAKVSLSLSMVIITFIVLWKNRASKEIVLRGFMPLLPLSVIIAPLAWQHYFVLIIPALISLYFSYRKAKEKLINYLPLALTYVLIASNLKNPDLFPLVIQSHVLWGAMILWWLSLREVRGL